MLRDVSRQSAAQDPGFDGTGALSPKEPSPPSPFPRLAVPETCQPSPHRSADFRLSESLDAGLPGQWHPRVRIGQGFSCTVAQRKQIEAILPQWVEDITLSRRKVSRHQRDSPPGFTGSWGEEAQGLHALIRLAARPPVGAVPQLQLSIYQILGTWPFRQVVGNFSPDPLRRFAGISETPLRKEIHRTLPVGSELIGLEEFLLRSGRRSLHFAVARVHSDTPLVVQRWKEEFQRQHGRLVLLDHETSPSAWIESLRKRAGRRKILPLREVSTLCAAMLRRATLPEAVKESRPHRPVERLDLTALDWTRVDSKECLVAEDVFHVRLLPNGYTELLVGIIDAVSPGRPPEVPSRGWGLLCTWKTP